MDGKHVVFGSVIAGKSLVREIENIPTQGSDKPHIPVTIADCGELPADYQVSETSKADAYGDAFADFPEDAREDDKEFSAAEVVKITTKIKGYGTKAFKENKLEMAITKYKKALRYLNEDPATEGASKEDIEALKQLRITLNSNIALLSAKVAQAVGKEKGSKDAYADAIKHATFALDVQDISDADKAKCHYRRALGHKGARDVESALKDLDKAKQLEPNDPLVLNEIKALKAAQAAEIAKAKKVYAKAFE